MSHTTHPTLLQKPGACRPNAGNTGDTASASIWSRKLVRVLASRAMVLSTACVSLTPCVSAAANKQPISSVALACDGELKTAMSSNADTKVLLVQQFHRGEPLLLTGAPTTSTPSAG